MSPELFHPAVRRWFEGAFAAPTPCQQAAWPAIKSGEHTLIAAPTGSGKTLAAFLCALDELVCRDLNGTLEDAIQVVYVSPLKALSNDVQKNLEAPLAGIAAQVIAGGGLGLSLRTFVRTGDTPAQARAAMRRLPPHILVTTPESLYILMTTASGRAALAGTRTVIVDEIHALAGSKRGAHLALTLARLDALTVRPAVRVGLSATQNPIEVLASFLTGCDAAGAPRPCRIVDAGHVRRRDVAIELPDSPLEAVMSHEVWGEVYDRLTALIEAHRTTLVFVNTRRLAERVAHHLSERLGAAAVGAHHGSLSREQRLMAEQRLKAGKLRVLVATASLELGIDIGDVDLACQLGSTRAIATFLQRVGRSGHGIDRVPKGRLFPLSCDELVECVALVDAVDRGELDRLVIPAGALDVLAQQIVAAVASEDWDEDALYALVRRAWPYRDLSRERFAEVARMLGDGFSSRRGRDGAWLHRDAVNGVLRARRGARLTAITNGGTIPETAAYEVRQAPADLFVGTVDEDFAMESIAGDIFQLGNTSWRILRVEASVVRVEDAHGLPPNIPFWLGEAPARTLELSAAVARLRADVAARLEQGGDCARAWLSARAGVTAAAAEQVLAYLGAALATFGALPTLDTLVMERFFDESGGMQLIIHSPWGGRINRAWGLALRKRFCRTFNFELQAAATEDAIILSLGQTHSFALPEVWNFLKPASVRQVLVQALLDAPMFAVRWRWNATCALAVPRFRGGRKVAPKLQRMIAEDLAGVVFPDSRACFENIRGEREIPDHPLVAQTVHDCLTEAMDIDGLERLLDDIAGRRLRLIARDLTGPSPLAQAILTARPYAYLDDAPLEERRTLAVQGRRWLDADTAADLGRLDAQAIQRVCAEAWPQATSADELHDALCVFGCVSAAEGEAERWQPLFEALLASGRATRCAATPGAPELWLAAERTPWLRAIRPRAIFSPAVRVPAELAGETWTAEAALVELVRGRLEALGPVTAAALAATLGVGESAIAVALATLESEGFVMRGRFTAANAGEQWCDRRLLARIHRYTVERLRREIEPVSMADFMRFLCEWQHVGDSARVEGPQALAAVIEQLQGFAAPAAAWERDILPARVRDYAPARLDELCLSGRYLWSRADVPRAAQLRDRAPAPVKITPITFVARRTASAWRGAPAPGAQNTASGSAAVAVYAALERHGASFYDELVEHTGLLGAQIESALGELVALGLARCDSFMGLRALIAPAAARRRAARIARRPRFAAMEVDSAGRWALLAPRRDATDERTDAIEVVARALLARYGVVFRSLLAREAPVPPWRELLRVLRRLEARGEIRGGRFVSGVVGEQYALADAVGALRAIRRTAARAQLVSVSAADPLNRVGILVPGPRVPALAGNRVLYRDGVAVAVQIGAEIELLARTDAAGASRYRAALLRSAGPSGTRIVLGRTA
ncbi:MAG: DEAD/DEAH box helicase [Gammaproteobacteria bacterium]|nr:DEAD/DEAH box helicase [Gammaproteobacteria bacterium]